MKHWQKWNHFSGPLTQIFISKLRDNLKELEAQQEYVPLSIFTPEDFVCFDVSVVATELVLSIDEIIGSLQDSMDRIVVDDKMKDNECLQKPSCTDVRNATETLLDLAHLYPI